MTLSSSDPAVKMMIETIRNQDNSAHAAVDRIVCLLCTLFMAEY